MLGEPASKGVCPSCVLAGSWEMVLGGASVTLCFCSLLAENQAGCSPGATELEGTPTPIWAVVLLGGRTGACQSRAVTGQSFLLASLSVRVQ